MYYDKIVVRILFCMNVPIFSFQIKWVGKFKPYPFYSYSTITKEFSGFESVL